ncbi:MAG: DUF4332 domain-containing protein [Pirellulales bacterium]
MDDRGLWPHVDAPVGDDWLARMTTDGADLAHVHYDTLVKQYDLARGAVDPPRGWNDGCRAILAGLLAHAIVGFARIVERAIAESGATPPIRFPSLEAAICVIKAPWNAVLKSIDDHTARAEIAAIVAEVQATGKLEQNLPEENRAVRDEVQRYRASRPTMRKSAAASTTRPQPLPRPTTTSRTPTVSTPAAARPQVKPQPSPEPLKPVVEPPSTPAPERAKPVDAKSDAPQPSVVPVVVSPTVTPAPIVTTPANNTPPVKPVPEKPKVVAAPVAKPAEPLPTSKPKTTESVANEPAGRYRLELDDALERAPSIGPKTAKRLEAHGLRTVRDFLNADPTDVATKLNSSWAPADVIADWQHQAGLVLAIADLNGTSAQLLVGAGYAAASDVAATDAATLHADLKTFAGTKPGERILRDGKCPDQVAVARWIQAAGKARALRAA